MHKKICAACGELKTTTVIGRANVCNDCKPLMAEQTSSISNHNAKAIFRKKHGTPAVLQLRDVPPSLRKMLRLKALNEGKTERDLLLTMMWQYLKTK